MDLKIIDVADLLNVSESTVRRWISEGKTPNYRLNQHYFFSRTEIENWVISHKLDKTADGISPFMQKKEVDNQSAIQSATKSASQSQSQSTSQSTSQSACQSACQSASQSAS